MGHHLRPLGSGRWWKVDLQVSIGSLEGPNRWSPGDVDDFLESLSGKIWVGHSNLGQSEAQNQQFKHGSKSQQGRKVEHLVSISEISCPKKILAFAIIPELSQFMSSVTGGVIQRATTCYQQTWHNNQSVFEVSGPFSVQGCAPSYVCWFMLPTSHVNYFYVHHYIVHLPSQLNRDWNCVESNLGNINQLPIKNFLPSAHWTKLWKTVHWVRWWHIEFGDCR